MRNYLDLLKEIIVDGEHHDDRTGVGTRSLFGKQLRFDLRRGFPLVTTKKIHTKSVFIELLWMIQGRTDVEWLQKRGVTIWDSWTDEAGSIGLGYGKQWRHIERIDLVEPTKFDPPMFALDPKKVAGVGVNKGARVGNEHLYSVWNEMLHRCYDKSKSSYERYGAKGYHVHKRWHDFINFIEDVKKLPGWALKATWPDEYSLDKDVSGTNRYGPDTCVWLSKREQPLNTVRSRLLRVTPPKGDSYLTMDVSRLCQDIGLDPSAVYACARGTKHGHKGYKFEWVDVGDRLPRVRIVDQLREVVAAVKQTPESRRIVLSSWNPLDVPAMQLPPCHSWAQFKVHVETNELSCHMYQRSADVFLGVPFNIASYALLTHLVANSTGLTPRDLIISYGDVHIYSNHMEQVRLQIAREPKTLPTLHLPPGKDLFNVEYDDIKVTGYESYPAIRAKVAV